MWPIPYDDMVLKPSGAPVIFKYFISPAKHATIEATFFGKFSEIRDSLTQYGGNVINFTLVFFFVLHLGREIVHIGLQFRFSCNRFWGGAWSSQ